MRPAETHRWWCFLSSTFTVHYHSFIRQFHFFNILCHFLSNYKSHSVPSSFLLCGAMHLGIASSFVFSFIFSPLSCLYHSKCNFHHLQYFFFVVSFMMYIVAGRIFWTLMCQLHLRFGFHLPKGRSESKAGRGFTNMSVASLSAC